MVGFGQFFWVGLEPVLRVRKAVVLDFCGWYLRSLQMKGFEYFDPLELDILGVDIFPVGRSSGCFQK